MRWAAVDFETATHDRASACALGVVVVEGGVEIERRSWLIRPPHNAYDPRNIEIHGISPQQTATAPTFDAVWDEAMQVIGDRHLIAHNASFDVGVIRGGCDAYRMQPPSSPYLCTVQLARRTWPELGAHRLPIVAGHVGAELDHHDALSDAAACSKILRACIDAAGLDGVDALVEHHALRERRVDVR